MRVLFAFKNTGDFGIEMLSAYLKRAGHETDLVFDPGGADYILQLPFLKIKDINEMMVEKAKQFKPDLIVFSSLTNLYPWILNLSSMFKRALNAPIIAGGIHATAMPEKMLEHDAIDMVCIGEGEEALLELVEQLKSGKLTYDIKNIWFKKDGNIIKNPLRPLVQNLDTLPFGDKEMFGKYGVTTYRLYAMTGRGCPFSCSYCCNQIYLKIYEGKGKFCRQKSPEYTIRELEHHLSIFKKVKEIFFYDEIFTLNNNFLREFLPKYKARIKKTLRFFIRPGFADDKMLAMLRDAGGKYATMGVEVGNEKIRREILKRKISQEDILLTAKKIKAAGMKLTTLNFLGSPGETPENMWETIELNRKIKPNGACVGALFPYPGTEMVNMLINKKILNLDQIHEVWKSGKNSYQDTIINHPYEKEINHTKRFFPLLVCFFPKFLDFIIKKLPPWNIFGLFGIYFMGSFTHFFYKTTDLLFMTFRTKKTLKKYRHNANQ